VGHAHPQVRSSPARRIATAGALLVCVLVAGAPVVAASSSHLPSIGYLADEPTPDSIPVLRAALRERAWIEGQSVKIRDRYAQGKPELYALYAAELARLDVAVIVAVGVPAIEAARRATKTIPIVMVSVDDPVAAGLTPDPGANLTGLTAFVAELSARRLELLKEVVPGVVRATALFNPTSTSAAADLRVTQAAAQARSVELASVEVRGESDIKEVFTKVQAQRPQGLIVVADALTLARREPIATLARRARLPAVYALRDFADAGGLLSYGAAWSDLFRQAAGFVDRILKGARPSELPVTRASRFELVINLRTARALALPLPASLLRRADRVIE
jgi:putative tryptophan/tyrosine transport system substrate-binding protein